MDFSPSSEQRQLVDLAARLTRQLAPNPRVSWEEAAEFPWDFAQALAAHDLTGIDLPETIGGQGLALLDAMLVLESVSSNHPHVGDAVQATNFGAVRQIAAFAKEEVVDEVLRPILAGRALATIAMSEPGAGSFVSDLLTRATVDGDTVVINGSKVFNSNGPNATHYVVWARFGDGKDQVGAVVVPATADGFSRGATERFISGEAHCTLSFEGCRVPRRNVLLESNALRRMLSVFNIERLGNATRSLGLGELAFRLAATHLVERQTPRGRLADLQGLRWKLADIRIRLDSARLLLYRAASELRDGMPDALATSLAKCAANEAGFFAANEALQIFGGYGMTTEMPLDYIFKRTRGWMIAGGSVEIQRNRIASEILRRFESDS